MHSSKVTAHSQKQKREQRLPVTAGKGSGELSNRYEAAAGDEKEPWKWTV